MNEHNNPPYKESESISVSFGSLSQPVNEGEESASLNDKTLDAVPAREPYPLGPLVILSYLAIFMLYKQFIFGDHVFVYLRLAFYAALLIYLAFLGKPFRPGDIITTLKGTRCTALLVIVSIVCIVTFRLIVKFFLFNSTSDVSPLTLPSFLDECVVAPINEEVLFRGIFLSILLRQMPNRPEIAILFSTLIFTASHNLSYGSVVGLSILGFLLGQVYYRSRSLGLCMALHMLWNALLYIPKPPSP